MTVQFTPEIIQQLQTKVQQHNGQAAPEFHVKLHAMKKLFKRWANGGVEAALQKIDDHLHRLGGNLEKARRPGARREPFDPSEHPRRRGGQFASTGGGHAVQVAGAVNAPVTIQGPGHPIQVIPETRYSVYGPPIAGAAGLALGATGGATVGLKQTLTGGSALDRLATRGAGFVGDKTGELLGAAIGGAAHRIKAGLRAGARTATAATGMRVPRPAQSNLDAARTAGAAKGKTIGRAVGRGLGQTSQFVTNIGPALARHVVEGSNPTLVRRIVARGTGGIAGAALAGSLLYGPALYHAAQRVGPFLDASHPRRVRKADGSAITDEEILAKVEEILADEDLAKISLGSIGNIVRSANRLVGRPAIAAASRIFRRRPPVMRPFHPRAQFGTVPFEPPPAYGGGTSGIPPRTAGEPTTPIAAARTAFEHGTAGRPDALKPRRLGQAIRVARVAVPIAGAGAALGGLSGYAAQRFNLLHPRDERGRFAHKSQATITGAKIGAGVGLGLGIGAGLLAARHGHTQLLRAAIARLGETAEVMREDTAKGAGAAHAADFRARNSKLVGDLSPGSADAPDLVERSLKRSAGNAWARTPFGQALREGGKAVYRLRIEEGFDRAVRAQLLQHGPLLDRGDKSIPRNVFNLFQHVDPERLNANQRRIWDDLVSKRERVLQEVDAAYARAAEAKVGTIPDVAALRAEHARLDTAVKVFERDAESLLENGTTQQIRDFMKTNMGHTLKARTQDGARKELADEGDKWLEATQDRIDKLPDEIKQGEKLAEAAKQYEGDDLSEVDRTAILNPFATGRTRHFPPVPDYAVTRDKIETAAAKPFKAESEAYIQQALGHLDAFIAADQARHAARIPQAGAARRAFRRALPIVTARLEQGIADARELQSASKASLTGVPKKVSDFFDANRSVNGAWTTATKAANWGKKHGKTAGTFTAKNWRAITGLVTLGGAVGAIDLQAEGRKKIRLNPRRWNFSPKGIAPVIEHPAPLDRPYEAIVGVKYRDKDGRDKFLVGWHMTSEDGAQRSMIPFGADVNQILSRSRELARQGSGSPAGMRAGNIPIPQNQLQAVNNALNQLRSKFREVGPDGSKFYERDATDQVQGNANQHVANAFFNAHLQGVDKATGISDPEKYWTALGTLFNAPNARLLTTAERTTALVGTPDRAGIFKNANNDLRQQHDHGRVERELISQIRAHGNKLEPTEPHQYHALKQAMWTVMSHNRLNESEMRPVFEAIDKVYENSGKPVPGTPSGAGAPQGSFEEQRDDFLDRIVRANPPEIRVRSMQDDRKFRDALQALYDQHLASEDHTAAQRSVNQSLHRMLRPMQQQAPTGGLRKYLVNEPAAPARFPKPRIGGSSKPPGIGGSYLRQEAHPARALSQAGAYGLGQAGYAAAKFAGDHFFPGGGTIPSIARFGAELIGGVGGGTVGQVGGARLGRRIAGSAGPQMSDRESLARSGAGVAGTVAGTALGARPGVQRALVGGARLAARPIAGAASAVGRRVASTAVGSAVRGAATGLGERIGGAIGGWVGRGAGAAAGTVAEPGAGTALGSAGGFVAGQALGAGLGWLADEGVGLLYHHLSRYGSHVPAMAAKTLGHAPRTPRTTAPA